MHDFMKALEALAGAPVLKLLILDAALKGLVVLAAGSAVAWALRRSAAATRHCARARPRSAWRPGRSGGRGGARRAHRTSRCR